MDFLRFGGGLRAPATKISYIPQKSPAYMRKIGKAYGIHIAGPVHNFVKMWYTADKLYERNGFNP